MWTHEGVAAKVGVRTLVDLAFAATLVVGCGGTITDSSRGIGTGEASGGAIGEGGAGNAVGGRVAATGGSAMGRGGAGTPGAGGSTGACTDTPCTPIACPLGYVTTQLPGDCCPTCVNRCAAVDCAQPKCAPGSVLTTLPGNCCPSCSPDCSLVDCANPNCPPGSTIVSTPGKCCGSCQPTDAGPVCNAGIADYMRQQISAVDGLACVTASDCQIVSLGGRCRLDCGTAVNVSAAGPLTKEAQAYSDANCSGCIVTDVACSPVLYTAECQNGQCTHVP